MKEKYPIIANNVMMKDLKTGLQLRGVLIRPGIESEGDKRGRTSRFVEGNYYVVTTEATAGGKRMDAFVGQDTYSRIVAGKEVGVKSHLTPRIDLKYVIDEALKDVLLNNK